MFLNVQHQLSFFNMHPSQATEAATILVLQMWLFQNVKLDFKCSSSLLLLSQNKTKLKHPVCMFMCKGRGMGMLTISAPCAFKHSTW